MGIFNKFINNVKKEIKQATGPSDNIYCYGRYICTYKDKESLPNDIEELHWMKLYYEGPFYKNEDRRNIIKDIIWKANELVQNGAFDENDWVLIGMWDYFRVPAEEIYVYERFMRKIKRSHISEQAFMERKANKSKWGKRLLDYKIFPEFLNLKKEDTAMYFDKHIEALIEVTCTLLEEEKKGKSIIYSGVYMYEGLMNYMVEFLEDTAFFFDLSYWDTLAKYIRVAHFKLDEYDIPWERPLYPYSQQNVDDFVQLQRHAKEVLPHMSSAELRYQWEEVKKLKEEDIVVEKTEKKETYKDVKVEYTKTVTTSMKSTPEEEYDRIAKEQITLFHKKCKGPDNDYEENTVCDLLDILLSIEHPSYYEELLANSDNFGKYNANYIRYIYDQYEERIDTFKHVVSNKYKIELENLNKKRPWAFYTLKHSHDVVKVKEALSILENINDIEQYDKISIKMAVFVYLFIHSNVLTKEERKYFEQKFMNYLKDTISFGNNSMQKVLNAFTFKNLNNNSFSKYEKSYFEKIQLLLSLLHNHIEEEPSNKDTYEIHHLLDLIKNDFFNELYIAIVETYRGKENKNVDFDGKKFYGFQGIVDCSEERRYCMKSVLEELDELEHKRVWALSLDETTSPIEFKEALSILEEVGELYQLDYFYIDLAKYVNKYMMNLEIDSDDYVFFEKKFISYLDIAYEFGRYDAKVMLDDYWNIKEEWKKMDLLEESQDDNSSNMTSSLKEEEVHKVDNALENEKNSTEDSEEMSDEAVFSDEVEALFDICGNDENEKMKEAYDTLNNMYANTTNLNVIKRMGNAASANAFHSYNESYDETYQSYEYHKKALEWYKKGMDLKDEECINLVNQKARDIKILEDCKKLIQKETKEQEKKDIIAYFFDKTLEIGDSNEYINETDYYDKLVNLLPISMLFAKNAKEYEYYKEKMYLAIQKTKEILEHTMCMEIEDVLPTIESNEIIERSLNHYHDFIYKYYLKSKLNDPIYFEELKYSISNGFVYSKVQALQWEYLEELMESICMLINKEKEDDVFTCMGCLLYRGLYDYFTNTEERFKEGKKNSTYFFDAFLEAHIYASALHFVYGKEKNAYCYPSDDVLSFLKQYLDFTAQKEKLNIESYTKANLVACYLSLKETILASIY